MLGYSRCSTAWKQRIGLFSSSLVSRESLEDMKKRIIKAKNEVTQSAIMKNELSKIEAKKKKGELGGEDYAIK